MSRPVQVALLCFALGFAWGRPGLAEGDEGHERAERRALAAQPPRAAQPSDPAEEDEEEIEEVEAVAVAAPGLGPRSLPDLLGRLHPAVVHFPIAWLLLLFGLELWRLRAQGLDGWSLISHIACALSFLPAIASGLLREEALEKAARLHDLVETHETLGFVVAGLVGAALALRLVRRNRLRGGARAAHLLLLGLAAGLVVVAAHYGGKLAFGPDFLPF